MISRTNRRLLVSILLRVFLLTAIVTSGLAIATPMVEAEAIPDPDPCELPLEPNPACPLPDPSEIIDPHDLPGPCDDPLGIICDPPDPTEIIDPQDLPHPCAIAPCEPALDPCDDLGICDPVGDITQLVNDTTESLPDPQVVIDEIQEVVENLPSDPCQDLGVGCEDPSDTINDAIYALVGLVGQLADAPCEELGYGCDPQGEVAQLLADIQAEVQYLVENVPNPCEDPEFCDPTDQLNQLLQQALAIVQQVIDIIEGNSPEDPAGTITGLLNTAIGLAGQAVGIVLGIVGSLPDSGEAVCPEGAGPFYASGIPPVIPSHCGFVGEVVIDGAAGVVVPGPGKSKAAIRRGVTSSDEIHVRTLNDGTVLVNSIAQPCSLSVSEDCEDLPEPTHDPCQDTRFRLYDWRSPDVFRWYLNEGSLPDSLDLPEARLAIIQGFQNWEDENTDCEFAQMGSTFNHDFLGNTAAHANIYTHAEEAMICDEDTGGDKSVVEFRPLGRTPDGDRTIAFFCPDVDDEGFDTGELESADILLSPDDIWSTDMSTCEAREGYLSGEYVLEGIVTHEAGHAVGLGDIDDLPKTNLTMGTGAFKCDDSHVTLGLGDLMGMESRHPYNPPAG